MSMDQCLEQLNSSEGPVSAALLASLSALEPEELSHFKNAWRSTAPDRRLKAVSTLIDLAEDNVELDFSNIFRHVLDDEVDEVRAAAVAGLWEYEEPSLIPPLVNMLDQDPAEQVRTAAAQAQGRFAVLAEMGKLHSRDTNTIGDALLEAIDNENETIEVRRRAVEAIAPMSLPQVPQIITEAFESEEPLVRASALYAMGRTCDSKWLPTLIDELNSPDPEMRFEALGALGDLGDEEAVPYIIPLIRDPDAQILSAAIQAFGAIGGPMAKQALQQALSIDDPLVQELVTAALQSVEFDDDPSGT